jgi:hypothetical protein
MAEPLYSQGSDEDSPTTGLSSQIEKLSLSESNESDGSPSAGWGKGKQKGKGGAQDVWKFFEKKEGEKGRRGRGKGEREEMVNVGQFCMWVSTICKFHYKCLHFLLSTAQEKNQDHHVASFGSGTGISNLRKHLIKDHLQAWTKACSDMGIEITACSALQHIRRLEGLEDAEDDHPQYTKEADHPQYTKEAFVDALIEFIVGDDVVSTNDHIIVQFSCQS